MLESPSNPLKARIVA